MDRRSLEDLIALARSPSLTAAAEQRHVTQPAFLRRIRALEDTLGVELAARNARPARPSDPLLKSLPHIEAIARSLTNLERELRHNSPSDEEITIAAIHTIAMVHLPDVMEDLQGALGPASLEVRAADREDCFTAVMIGQASIALYLEAADARLNVDDELVIHEVVDEDVLGAYIGGPAAARGRLLDALQAPDASVPLVALCPSGALGRIVHDALLPVAPCAFHRVASSAFVPAVMSHCMAGSGVAFLPRSLATSAIADGTLLPVPAALSFPEASLDLVMLRARRQQTPREAKAWGALKASLSHRRAAPQTTSITHPPHHSAPATS
ncbi:MAG: LysR family transcriptional regulator [Pseudomonadota bacterium]